MKKQFLLLAIAMITGMSYATVRTVNNNPNAVAQYSSLSDAVTASSVGDSIYLIGSPTNYGDISITKSIVIIGSGYSVTGTPYNFNTMVNTITIDSVNGGSKVSGLHFSGLWITGSIYSGSNTTFTKPDITFERCRIDGYMYVLGNGWILKNNFINSALNLNNYSNILISNNVIFGYITNSNSSSVLVTNNDFITSYYGGFITVTSALITNNIFYQISSFYSNVQNNTFNKNIGYHSTNTITLPPANNNGSGNISNTNPAFVNVPTSAYYSNETTYSYDLQGGSPAINAGTDGKDMGVYGGIEAMPNITGAGHLPQIVVFDINNSILPKNGTLSVNVKARKQN